MTLDVRGSLKNTKINKNYYVVIDELLSNAIDSYLIRKSTDKVVKGLKVNFKIELFSRESDAKQDDLKITCTDNGVGLGSEQTKAFVTKDTSYKDDLTIAGIGKCKGSGRVQFFHYFSNIKIDSIYKDEGAYKRRTLLIDEGTKEIEDNSFEVRDTDSDELKTTIVLESIASSVYDRMFLDKNLRDKFSTDSLKRYVMVAFLQRFVSLKEMLGDLCVTFISFVDGNEIEDSLVLDDFPDVSESKNVKIYFQDDDGVPLHDSEMCTVSHYKLNKDVYKLRRNTVALCAKSSIVKVVSSKYLRTKTLENNPVNDCYHIILIESEFLDTYVNEQRDNFNLPSIPQGTDNLFDRIISFQELYDDLDDCILTMLEPPDWDKKKIVEKVENKYGVSAEMVAEVNVRVRYGDTEESIVKRVLGKYQEKIIKDTSEIFDIKEDIYKSDPNADDFRVKINDLAWKYTSSLRSVDMANLSQIIVRRSAILEVLSLAISKGLSVQNCPNKKRNENEKIIHNIFFPMRKDSNEPASESIFLDKTSIYN